MKSPYKKVVKVEEGTVVNVTQNHGSLTMFWMLTLECGHKQQRSRLQCYMAPGKLKCKLCRI